MAIMLNDHKSIKRIVHRISEELSATKKISALTSWPDAFAILRAKTDIQIMNHNGYYESPTAKKHLIKKHQVMIDYYEKAFSDFLSNYSNSTQISNDDKENMSDCIWVCWWQGLDLAPAIVKSCVKSIEENSAGHRVIILTDDNYKDYVNIPDWVQEKKNKGIISRTNYSDLLRLSLLAEHGCG